MSDFLYRGISEAKYLKDGKTIKPYLKGAPDSIIHLDEGHYLDEGFTLDNSINNSVIKHQKDSKKYHTPYISTTPHFEIAKHYALHGGKHNKGFVFKIDRKLLPKFNVKEEPVKLYTNSPNIPKDDEVCLYTKNGKELPQDLIVELLEVKK